MITKITLKNIASYKEETSLKTNKIVNLIYGLNGAGKTILSEYLSSLNGEEHKEKEEGHKHDFSACSFEGFKKESQKILVYNQKYIDDNFSLTDKQKRIFTIGEENKRALENISQANDKLRNLRNELKKENENGFQHKFDKKKKEKQTRLNEAQDRIFNIKRQDTEGDNIFNKAGFFSGLKGSKENFFKHLVGIALPEKKPQKTINDIKEQMKVISGDNVIEKDLLNIITTNISKIEDDKIFEENIVGNKDSAIADLITKLKNSDWVEHGLKFVDIEERKNCPFCQKETLNENLVTNIKNYFDKEYKKKTEKITEFQEEYKGFNINREEYKKKLSTAEEKNKLEDLLNNFYKKRTDNLQKIKEKTQNPSQKIELQSTAEEINNIKQFIEEKNEEIEKHNEKIKIKRMSKKN